MQISATTLLLGVVVLAAVGYAVFGGSAPTLDAPRASTAPPAATGPDETMPELPQEDPEGTADPGTDETQDMAEDIAPDREPPAITWSVPTGWKTVPNPSSMRIATYLVHRAAHDENDAEVSVVRAGGGESSNIQRWADQFEGSTPVRRTKKVRGLDVTVVEIEGAYTNTMMENAGPQPGWALVAAIVKTQGQPYFFKMTGPVATVRGALGAFGNLVESIQPVK
jgi:hypothetical protein